MKVVFSRHVFEKKMLKYQNFIKIHLLEAELLHADGRTKGRKDRHVDRRDEANNRLSQFLERE
jgi:hypothetical protein